MHPRQIEKRSDIAYRDTIHSTLLLSYILDCCEFFGSNGGGNSPNGRLTIFQIISNSYIGPGGIREDAPLGFIGTTRIRTEPPEPIAVVSHIFVNTPRCYDIVIIFEYICHFSAIITAGLGNYNEEPTRIVVARQNKFRFYTFRVNQ
jgi:hypothetical protein